MSDQPKTTEVEPADFIKIAEAVVQEKARFADSCWIEEVHLDHDQVERLTGEEPAGGWKVFVIHYL